MPEFFTTGQVSRRSGIAPHIISGLFYRQILDTDRCPVVSGRRLIPGDYLPELEAVLRERGLIGEEAGPTAKAAS